MNIPNYAPRFFRFSIGVLLFVICLFTRPAAADDSAEPPVAKVNGTPVTAAEVDAYAEMYQLPQGFALREYIETMLLKSAATGQKIALPPEPWSTEVREGVEVAVARGLNIDGAQPRRDVVVDHAWIKDVTNAKQQAATRKSLEKLRALVVAGSTIPQAFARLKLNGSLWHIGDHEVYPAASLPEEATKLAPGSVSPIIPGDGGLHLFTLYERKESAEPDAPMIIISERLRDELRKRATVELRD